MKKVPDEWQARQVMRAILQLSNSKHNANKNTTRASGSFHQSITAILCIYIYHVQQKKKEKQLLLLHMLQSTCFDSGPRSRQE